MLANSVMSVIAYALYALITLLVMEALLPNSYIRKLQSWIVYFIFATIMLAIFSAVAYNVFTVLVALYKHL